MSLFNVQTAKVFNDFLERLRAAQNPKKHGTVNPVFCVFTRKPIYGVDYHNSPDLVIQNLDTDEVVFIVRKLVEQKEVIDMLIPLERDLKASEIHAEYKTQIEARDKSVARLVYSLISVIVLLMGALTWSLLR